MRDKLARQALHSNPRAALSSLCSQALVYSGFRFAGQIEGLLKQMRFFSAGIPSGPRFRFAEKFNEDPRSPTLGGSVKAISRGVHFCRPSRLMSAVTVLVLLFSLASMGGALAQGVSDSTSIRIPAGVAAGMLQEKTAPVYPPLAKAARVQGTVVLEATISKAGFIENLHVISGPAMLQQAALDSVKTWRYRPFLLNGQPVEVIAPVNIIFSLAPPTSDENASAPPAEPQAGPGDQAQAAPATETPAAAPTAGTAPAATFRVGGESIAIPSPTGDMVEIGVDHRVLFDVVVPDMNRLVAAFLLEKDAAQLQSTNNSGPLSPYALVEVLRQGEFAEIDASDFKTLSGQMGQQLGSIIDSSVKETQEEFDRRMKAMNLDNKIDYGQPVMLGTLFSQTDACGFGMLAPVTMNGTSVKMVVSVILLRVKSHVLFAYFYVAYKDEKSTDWVRTTSQQWSDAILAANPE